MELNLTLAAWKRFQVVGQLRRLHRRVPAGYWESVCRGDPLRQKASQLQCQSPDNVDQHEPPYFRHTLCMAQNRLRCSGKGSGRPARFRAPCPSPQFRLPCPGMDSGGPHRPRQAPWFNHVKYRRRSLDGVESDFGSQEALPGVRVDQAMVCQRSGGCRPHRCAPAGYWESVCRGTLRGRNCTSYGVCLPITWTSAKMNVILQNH